MTFNENFKIGFSKNTNNLPLTEFRVQADTPCMDEHSIMSFPDDSSEENLNIF